MDPSRPIIAIPPELLRPIFDYLQNDKASLRAISLSSSAFRQEGQRILFRDVTDDLQTAETHLIFLRTVISSSRLALLVRAYTPHGSSIIYRETLDVIREGLEAMRNLTCLDLTYSNGCGSGASATSPPGIAWIFRGCTFSLQRLLWYHGPFGADIQELVENFMPRQHTLKHLSLAYFGCPCMRNFRSIFASMCPHLVSLEGDWEVIKALLPGRKITTLTVLPSGNPSIVDVRSLIPELKYIKAFSYMAFIRPIPEEMELVLRHCSSVTVFELGGFRGEADYEGLLSMLPKFPTLHTLILSRGQHSNKPLEEHQIRCLFDNATNLQCIDMAIDTKSDMYARYMRHQASALEEVTENEVRKLWLVG